MNQQPTAHPDYESLKSVWNSIAQWVMNYRHARGIYNDLANCGPDEMERIARDLRIHRSELVTMAKKGPHAADLVKKLLVALGIDADKPRTRRSAYYARSPSALHNLHRKKTMPV